MSDSTDKQQQSQSSPASGGDEKIQFNLSGKGPEVNASPSEISTIDTGRPASSPANTGQLPLGERKLTTDSRLPEDLELSTYETRSIDERVPPWKPTGPWYSDVIRRRWLLLAIVAVIIVIIVVVVPIVATKK